MRLEDFITARVELQALPRSIAARIVSGASGCGYASVSGAVLVETRRHRKCGICVLMFSMHDRAYGEQLGDGGVDSASSTRLIRAAYAFSLLGRTCPEACVFVSGGGLKMLAAAVE
jgi:hypothetical protein